MAKPTDRCKWLHDTAIALRNGLEIDREAIADFLEESVEAIEVDYITAKQNFAVCQKFMPDEYEYRSVLRTRSALAIENLEGESPSLKEAD